MGMKKAAPLWGVNALTPEERRNFLDRVLAGETVSKLALERGIRVRSLSKSIRGLAQKLSPEVRAKLPFYLQEPVRQYAR